MNLNMDVQWDVHQISRDLGGLGQEIHPVYGLIMASYVVKEILIDKIIRVG